MQPTQKADRLFERRFSPMHVPADRYADDSDIILFMHIPKTAGMSVGKTLRKAFDVFHPISWEFPGKSFRNKSKTALYNRTGDVAVRQVLMGHFNWQDVMFWENNKLPIKCATIIRDPVARFVSNYRYNCSTKHPQNAEFRERYPNLESYAEDLPYDYQLSLMVGAFYSFDHALEKLSTHYSFIGATEHLGASLRHFQQSHGLKRELREHRENTAARRADSNSATEVSDRVINKVYGKSRNDLRLHQMISRFYTDSAAAQAAPDASGAA